jgi:outer membrane immunogenic protein
MKRFSLVVAFAAMASAGPAFAADLVRPIVPPPVQVAVPAAYDWSGHYVGAHAGYIWGDAVVDPILVGGNISGFIGGVLGGFNVLHDGHIFGLEADGGWTHAVGNGANLADTYHYDLSWTAHLRARFGVPMGNNLFFIAGGAAFAGFDVFEDFKQGGTYTGWTAGAGIDHGFSPQLVGRAEFLYDDFGSKHYPGFNASLTAWTARVALIYRFGSH